MSQTPIQRATQLREQLGRAAEAYYNRDEQLIPDAEYDALLARDATLEFARSGKARAAPRAELASRLQGLIDKPERLAGQEAA